MAYDEPAHWFPPAVQYFPTPLLLPASPGFTHAEPPPPAPPIPDVDEDVEDDDEDVEDDDEEEVVDELLLPQATSDANINTAKELRFIAYPLRVG